jgi:hypothetical protein
MATLSRRNFLLAAGAGGAAAAAALAAKSPLPARPVTGDADRRATRGYQASAHVHHYYRTTKV